MTARYITLKDITAASRPSREVLRHVSELHTDTGEDDGMGQGNPAPAAEAVSPGWKPNTVATDTIRNFYPREGGQEGCRVILKSGTSYAVLDTHAEILAMLNA